jgi:hypothetical protein
MGGKPLPVIGCRVNSNRNFNEIHIQDSNQQREREIGALERPRVIVHVFLFENRARIKGLFRDARMWWVDVIPACVAGASSSYLIAVVYRTSLGAYGPYRISRRHLGLGGFLPRIEGPVLETVERKASNEFSKKKRYMHRFFASAIQALSSKHKKGRDGGEHACACGMKGCVCVKMS